MSGIHANPLGHFVRVEPVDKGFECRAILGEQFEAEPVLLRILDFTLPTVNGVGGPFNLHAGREALLNGGPGELLGGGSLA